MSATQTAAFDDRVARLQTLLAALDDIDDPAAASTARALVQAVLELHGLGLAELLAIVDEAASQPADTLLPKFAANPRVGGLLLLHDLHPQDMPTRARQAIEHLRPQLGVRGVRVDFIGVDDASVVHVRVAASGQKTVRPPASELRQEITDAVLAAAPDAAELVIDGLDATANASEVYVPLPAIHRRRSDAVGEKRSASGE